MQSSVPETAITVKTHTFQSIVLSSGRLYLRRSLRKVGMPASTGGVYRTM